MTLAEIWLLIKHYWKLVVVIPIVAALVCCIVIVANNNGLGERGKQVATARIVVNSQIAAVSGIAQSEARKAIPNDNGYTALAKAENSAMTVTITITGPDLSTCIELANEIAEKTVEASELFYADQGNKQNMVQFLAEIERANPNLDSNDTVKDLNSLLKYVAIALLAGLVVAVGVVIILDIRRNYVKTSEGVQNATGLHVLEMMPVPDGERLFANIKFAVGKDDLRTILIVPTNSKKSAEEAELLLSEAISSHDTGETKVLVVPPLSTDISGAYIARSSDAVILTATKWVDDLKQMQSALAELNLAGANIAGVALYDGEKNR